ncbi:nitrite reductase large subunit NirB [Schlesneria sp. DSM 10557]|uniref:nitrite reductase large subunit NirB n=1 Tax=Schlesneria sp. DSM 10557 TaxID=3044399 RepID=UPI0035A19479
MITAQSRQTCASDQQTIVVIGNGMVGLRFCEKLVQYDTARQYRIVTFCEEPRAAYDRVGLTSFFAHRDAEKLMLAKLDWYSANGVELHVGDRADRIDRQQRTVTSQKGVVIEYDRLVLATGSYPFVPKVPGIEKRGVFVYRTIEDLERMISHASTSRRCAVIGGGLLGLEAAKAVYDLGLEAHVIQNTGRLMHRQIDDAGSRVLVNQIAALGVHVHLNCTTKAVHGQTQVEGIEFDNGTRLPVDMIVVSAGIRPRDELAVLAHLELGPQGGVKIDDQLRTSDPHIYAIGECAYHNGMIYGLVAPGYEMADALASTLTGGDKRFEKADVSTKLKLMGVEVASFGDYEATIETATPLQFEDPFGGKYKKLLFSRDGKYLLGGILVGDASQYGMLSMLAKTRTVLPCPPHELIVGSSTSASAVGGIDSMPDSAPICSCNNVSKGAICAAITEHNLESPAAVKACTKAGASCGGCFAQVTDLFKAHMKRLGKNVSNHLCEHFAYSRTELFALIKLKQLKTFSEILKQYGTGTGCEICKPTIASILASLWNDNILDPRHEALQDTNDRFLANMQRGGLYSVVPRVPGGEITPEKLIVLGEVAQEYNLYTKITGGQRIDLFGAQVQDLPDIWEKLVDAGFESGHAYGKSLRTVKSCVGTTWCRYGLQDSVGFAIEVENRYKGIRSPHKIKMAVSGCTRECAEAQSKDVGLIAVEGGYNLYVCGNGGTKPRHAELLAAGIDEETAIRYIDRFLMYYIATADKLTRTSVWCDKLEGGIDHIRAVVIDDSLGLASELESRLQHLVDTYQCEWKSVVDDPEKRKRFRQFVNTEETEPCIEFVTERGQTRPADWPNEIVSLEQFQSDVDRQFGRVTDAETRWVKVGAVDDFPMDGGATVKYGKTQIAVFNYSSRGEWYATQNMCPHKKAFVLSRGLIGDANGTPKVACPLHKKTFSLKTGESLSDAEYKIKTFPIKVEGGSVYLDLPRVEILDDVYATEIGCSLATSCAEHPESVTAS